MQERSAAAGLQGQAGAVSIAHRFAVHIERLIACDWNVDCEYNRELAMVKELEGIRDCGRKKSDRIRPDIIVHRRGRQGAGNNLLVVEVKMNEGANACDRKKLELFTRSDLKYQYQLGLYINVDGGKFVRTWYKNRCVL